MLVRSIISIGIVLSFDLGLDSQLNIIRWNGFGGKLCWNVSNNVGETKFPSKSSHHLVVNLFSLGEKLGFLSFYIFCSQVKSPSGGKLAFFSEICSPFQ